MNLLDFTYGGLAYFHEKFLGSGLDLRINNISGQIGILTLPICRLLLPEFFSSLSDPWPIWLYTVIGISTILITQLLVKYYTRSEKRISNAFKKYSTRRKIISCIIAELMTLGFFLAWVFFLSN